MKLLKSLILGFIFVFSFQSLFSQAINADLQQIAADVVYLSSNYLEGREPGKKGARLSSDYLAWRFQEIGLEPKGDNGSYFDEFDFKFKPNPHEDKYDERTTRNVVGFIDNKAKTTVVIGAHYDHLGMGSHGSRWTGAPDIHNGADDNASGVASLLFLAEKLVAKKAPKKNNYLIIAFSGEELGLFGSKAYVEDPSIDLATVNYMLNMDMVGRLNEERMLVINGVGTSPIWKTLITDMDYKGIQTTTTESGIGPSDHTSFYLKNIPVLHFFTGQHNDYHKPTDDSELINYEGLLDLSNYIYIMIEKLDDDGKLAFTKTKDENKGKRAAKYKVTLGIMPDYVYDGEGLRIDGVFSGRPAANAGMEDGDIVVQLGKFKIADIYVYMEALAAYEPGDTVKAKVIRDGKEIEMDVTF